MSPKDITFGDFYFALTLYLFGNNIVDINKSYRFIFYYQWLFAGIYHHFSIFKEKLLNKQKANLYSSKLIQIPTPKCVVFYNGAKEQPDRMELKLSDSFNNQATKGDLELTVLMLNINFNHNKDLMDKCEILYAYSLYIAKFREYNENTELSLEEAAIKALDYCISISVMADFFTERRNEVVGMILEEYTKERVEQDIADMAQEIADMKQELSEKNAEIQSKDAEIQSKDAEIARLRQALSAR